VNRPSPRKLSLDSIRRIPNSTIWNLTRGPTAGTDRPVFQFKWGECSHAPGPIPSQAAHRCHLNLRDRSILLFMNRKAASNPIDRTVAPPNTWFMSDVLVPLYRRKTPEGMQSAASANPIFSCMLSAATLRCFLFGGFEHPFLRQALLVGQRATICFRVRRIDFRRVRQPNF